jgi:exopolyphosphatase / guanosine-5'-triphosphate,3'-diphosphate pyrophosphatase
MTSDAQNDNVDIPENYIGALDIGSNSFHFVFARIIEDNLQVLHSEKYQVKLASGLDKNFRLDEAAINRALSALADIAPLTEKLTNDNFKAVATYTLRRATNTRDLLNAATKVFPFDIEVISGHEEARLIYQGVAHYTSPNKQRLVIDIGGGSTECVIGKNLETKCLTSLNIGCVNFYNRFFSHNILSKNAFEQAVVCARQEIESHTKRFKKCGWQEVLGTSGTIKAIYNIINSQNDIARPITLSDLNELKDKLIKFGHVDNIELPNLKESRRKILAPGLAILIGITEMLKIEALNFCDYSLREGVLYEQLAQNATKDVRQRTVNSLTTRFNVDQEQVEAVHTVTLSMFEQVQSSWDLNKPIYLKLLTWAVQLHEVGFDINPSGYHKHGHYILSNADLPGFSLEQQQALAYLVGNQRKKLQPEDENLWYVLNYSLIERCLVILRLSILLQQQRQLSDPPSLTVSTKTHNILLNIDGGWLADKQLIFADLLNEAKQLKKLGYSLILPST